MEPLRFDTFELHEEKVVIGDAEYVLKEASSGAATKYRNALLECASIGSDGKPTKFSGMADVEPMLVSLCLFRADGSLVPLAEILGWRGMIVKALFERIKAISDLDEEGQLGNAQ